MPLPIERPSLVAEAARILRAAIRDGEYAQYLPPERLLSRTLNVSRPTLRAALAQLEREGFIDKQGRNARKTLVKQPRPSRLRAPSCVRLLQVAGPESFQHTSLDRNFFLAEHFAHAGIDFQVENMTAHRLQHPEHLLERLLGSRRADLWILHLSTGPMQQWFWARQVPSLVLGSVIDGIGFPSIDVDHRATCRHAAGMLLSRGHRSLALLCPRLMRMGDKTGLEGFMEGVAGSGQSGTRVCQASCSDSPDSARSAVDEMLAQPEQPDGWMILKARTCMTAYSYLASLGRQAGRDVSLLCRDPDPHFTALIPSVAHYERASGEMNRRILRLVPGLLRGSLPARMRVLVLSRFVPGDSLR